MIAFLKIVLNNLPASPPLSQHVCFLLCRVSEEKEVSVQRLKDEHQNFEQKIHRLEKQNVVIAQERESIL